MSDRETLLKMFAQAGTGTNDTNAADLQGLSKRDANIWSAIDAYQNNKLEPKSRYIGTFCFDASGTLIHSITC